MQGGASHRKRRGETGKALEQTCCSLDWCEDPDITAMENGLSPGPGTRRQKGLEYIVSLGESCL